MEKLFDVFNAVTAQDWKNQITKDLKGEAYESLQWQHNSGFVVEPFYTAENNKHTYAPAFTHMDWECSTAIDVSDDKAFNHQLLSRLDQGANAFDMKIGTHDLNIALNGVKLNFINATFAVNKSNVNQLRTFLETHYDLNAVHASLFYEGFDKLNNLDEWYRCMEFFFDFKKLKALCMDATSFHNNGASAHDEIAILFSGLIEQIEFLSKKGNIINGDLVIKTAVDSDFFTQIAKLRAIRRLWHCLKTEYNLSNNLYLVVETSLTNKTIGDKHNNLLRSSIESIAAVTGGCNELIVHPYDVFSPTKDPMAERLAINQQLILRHESYFDKFADVSCGSYFIEHLTDAIAEKALISLKSFQNQGGYLACIQNDVFKAIISKHAGIKQERIHDKKQFVIGVTKFKNEKEGLSLSEAEMNALKHLSIHNPALLYELQNFVNHA